MSEPAREDLSVGRRRCGLAESYTVGKAFRRQGDLAINGRRETLPKPDSDWVPPRRVPARQLTADESLLMKRLGALQANLHQEIRAVEGQLVRVEARLDEVLRLVRDIARQTGEPLPREQNDRTGKCMATARNGHRCQIDAMPGQVHCHVHGSNAEREAAGYRALPNNRKA
jgi:hypothetical protein